MADTPPRRSRRSADKRNDASFPLIPFLIGVIVLGFVIGAGLSMAGRHGSSPQVASVPVPTDEPTATPGPTLAPLATSRPLPTRTSHRTETTPVPRASVARVALASLPPSAAASPTAVATATPAAAATPTATTTPAAVRTHVATPIALVKSATPAIVTKAPATARATTAATAVPSTPVALPSVVPATSIQADSDFGRLSANVVRQYLRALARGDTQSAAGAFTPGTPNLAFPERTIMDSSAQIGSISARGSNDTQTVNAVISTSNGTYVGTYTVHKTPTGAAVIVSHTISKG